MRVRVQTGLALNKTKPHLNSIKREKINYRQNHKKHQNCEHSLFAFVLWLYACTWNHTLSFSYQKRDDDDFRLLSDAFWKELSLVKKESRSRKTKRAPWISCLTWSAKTFSCDFLWMFSASFSMKIQFVVVALVLPCFVGFGSFPLFVETFWWILLFVNARSRNKFIHLLYLCLLLLPVSCYSSRTLANARQNFWMRKELTHANRNNEKKNAAK